MRSTDARTRGSNAPLCHDEIRSASNHLGRGAGVGKTRGDRNRCLRAQIGTVGSRLHRQQHVQRIHRSIEPGFEDGDLRLDLSQRTLDLAHLQLGGDPLFELKLDRGEKLTARLRLLSGDRYARLQAADRDVHICRLRGHS